jgi:hypothetical protein
MIPRGILAAICMQSHAENFATNNVHTTVSQVSSERKLFRLVTVTFQGQQVQDDDDAILIIFAALNVSLFLLTHSSILNTVFRTSQVTFLLAMQGN